MDDAAQFEPEFDTESRVEEDGSSHEQYAGAFFPKAKNFVVAGGKFKSVTHVHHAAPNAPPDELEHIRSADILTLGSDFRVIPLGDLNLLQEIGVQRGADVVHRKNGGNSVRQMYSARVHGCKANMTVALYQGNGAENEWRKYISQYSDLRHAYLAQLYGVVNTGNLHAAVFHDDLIPCREVLEKDRDSHFTTVFLWNCINREFTDVNQYISSLSGRKLVWDEYTAWIRLSTGHLCIDLTPPETNDIVLANVVDGALPSGTSVFTPPSDSEMIMSMSLEEYHRVCYWHLSRWHSWSVSPNVSVKLGSIRHSLGPEYESSSEVVSSDCRIVDYGWATMDPIFKTHSHPINSDQGATIMENGWIRIRSAAVVNEYRRHINNNEASTWLAQANYIFDRLEIPRGFENFALVNAIEYNLQLSGATHNLPAGYLFLCPLAELQAEDPTCFRILDCIAYWSLDPSGVRRLSHETAEDLGFPAIKFGVDVWGRTWDPSVYDGIRQFHEAKGFDPYSQEVAIHLGYSAFQVSCDRATLLRHMHKKDACGSDSDSAAASYTGEGSESGDEQYVPSVYQHCTLEEAELLTPSRRFNIIMSVQLVLILTATALSLYEYLYPRS